MLVNQPYFANELSTKQSQSTLGYVSGGYSFIFFPVNMWGEYWFYSQYIHRSLKSIWVLNSSDGQSIGSKHAYTGGYVCIVTLEVFLASVQRFFFNLAANEMEPL